MDTAPNPSRELGKHIAIPPQVTTVTSTDIFSFEFLPIGVFWCPEVGSGVLGEEDGSPEAHKGKHRGRNLTGACRELSSLSV